MGGFTEEIMGQPTALAEVVQRYGPGQDQELMKARRLFEERSCRSVLFTGMGSSLFASYPACQRLNSHGIASWTRETAELLHYETEGISNDTLVVAVSQSGATIEVRRMIDALNRKVPVVGITNDTTSHLARNCDVVIPLYAGEQDAVSTKTYVNSVAVLLLLADCLSESSPGGLYDALNTIVDQMTELLDVLESDTDPMIEFLEPISYVGLIGRGPSFASACQGSLTLKEVARVPAEAMTAGQFRHGPIEITDAASSFVLFAPTGKTSGLMTKLAADIQSFGAKVLYISDTHLPESNKQSAHISHPGVDEYLAPLLNIIPVQLLAEAIARAMGLEPGKLDKASGITLEE